MMTTEKSVDAFHSSLGRRQSVSQGLYLIISATILAHSPPHVLFMSYECISGM